MKDKIRRLRAVAVVCEDDNGATRFEGDPGRIEAEAKAHTTKGISTWRYETRQGGQHLWPREPAAVVPGRDPFEASADRALYLAERFAELNAKAYRDAYQQVNSLMGTALDGYAAVVSALANRIISLEDSMQVQQVRTMEAQAQQTAASSDAMVLQVLEAAKDLAKADGGFKPNGAASK